MANEIETYLKSLELSISDQSSGYEVKLKGYKRIRAYFEQEEQFWTAKDQELRQKNSSDIPMLRNLIAFWRLLNSRLRPIGSETKLGDAQGHWKGFEGVFRSPDTHTGNQKVIFSKSAYAEFLIRQYSVNRNRGDGAYQFLSGSRPPQHDKDAFRGYLYGFQMESKLTGQEPSAELINQETLTRLRNEWEQKTVELTSAFENQKSEYEQWKATNVVDQENWSKGTRDSLSKFIDEKKEELSGLDSAYREKLKLEAPVKYWRYRAQVYRRRGTWWLCGLSGTTLLAISVLTVILYASPDSFKNALFGGNPEAFKGLIILATILSFFVYLVRVFAKLTFSSFHLERDAEEREQLTLVYLALTREGKISQEERDIVLQSVFSRADTGLLQGDSSPTMPIGAAFLEKFLKK